MPEPLTSWVETEVDPQPRLLAFTIAVTAAASVLVVGTLPFTVSSPAATVTLGVAALLGAGTALGAYVLWPRLAWLPFVPAAVAVAVLLAGSGGSASPYRALLLVLLVGGATLPRVGDVLIVATAVVSAALSPLIYEPWSQYGLLASAWEVAGWVLAALIVARVSAALRAARRQVERSARLVAQVLESLPQQAAVVEASGRIVVTNQAWDRTHALAGAAPGTFSPGADYATACRSRDAAVMVTPTELPADLQRVLAGEAESTVSELSWELLLGQHHRFIVRTTALPHGLGAVVTHEDITWLVDAEHSRQSLLRQVQDLDQRQAGLVRAISDDVRAPLAGVNTIANALRDRLAGVDDDIARPLVAQLLHGSQRLERALSGLLLLSLADIEEFAADGTPVVRREPTNLRQAIHAALERIEADGARKLVVHHVDPALVVQVDRTILDCVSQRLLDNAVRHTPPGTTIEVEVELTADGSTLYLHVTDDGPGIAVEDRERIFLPYERSRSSSTSDTSVGIGLTVAREAARLHGGDVELEPGDRAGNRFRATFDLGVHEPAT